MKTLAWLTGLLFFAINLPLASSQTRTIPSSFFGMHVDAPRNWPNVPIGALGKVAGLTWRSMEPERGVYNWGGLDGAVAAAQRHGVEVMYTFDATPQWASSRPNQKCFAGNIGCNALPRDLRDWEDFVRAVATRYKGKISVYEIWNEPNTKNEWAGSYKDMIQLAQAAYRTIKLISPNAGILTPAPSIHGYQPLGLTSAVQHKWLGEYLKAGGSAFADGGSFHAYVMQDDCRDSKLDCLGTPFVAQVRRIRSAMDDNGMQGMPIYVTEGGWGKDTELPDPDDQAAYIARWYILLASEGIQRAYWYEWDNANWGTLWDKTAGIHPAGLAYKQVYDWLVGASLGECSSGADGTWTCPLTRPGGYRGEIVWNSRISSYRPAREYSQYRDLSGRITHVQGPIQIGNKPILLETGTAR